MKNKLLGMVIVVLVVIIGYQSKIMQTLFLKKTVECNSNEAISLGTEIIQNELFNKIFKNQQHNVEDIVFNTIVTKKINKETGAQECQANVDIITDFKLPNSYNDPFKFFNMVLGSDNVITLEQNKYLISSSVWYTTEITTDAEKYLVHLKFDGDRSKGLYSKEKFTPNYNKNFETMLPFAKKGNALIQNQIGVMYADGRGVNQNTQEAINWYEKSAAQNNHWALYNLGFTYENKQDYPKAFSYYDKAAKLNNASAQYSLGNLYLEGKGIEQDYKRAYEYLKVSADNGNSNAMYKIGMLYVKGQGTEIDLNMALKYFEKAYEHGQKSILPLINELKKGLK